ncbi:hypothetical protein A3J19_02990 [Candidatus Daviesbacteria bacterium RIFCSPLOWO2_02_FULL_41_8]|uniref:Uncharacterized protein n=2 Tax=Candidatus Daviesiibacteriota TaxID=1752718 RepID=A0A1F5NMI5_9BACT|nr:MAG: hypothetical protein A2871_03850 [Candidatus Daviesbacteria bacterium RIFCSPHIGHO2_01_FULL_41_23]OGE62324.1 MAG: hypothetical protein A2967_02620 [Candidatus Daviesbacteria bacterium RIFCSPLOWO2_01_FULL_41_32]OGE78732.1 MAG: hypothetical protein A3J19_02990 [Candidatus Daviesbacteria bacterium RIFCSPLOWO2_02_FULL_41_8]
MLRESELELSRQGLRSFARVISAVRGVLEAQLGIDDIPFPVETIQPIRDFRARTLQLLAETRDPRPKERKALERKGWVFLQTEAKPLAQVIQEHPDHFGHIDDGLDLAAFTPPSLVVAIKPDQPTIHNSFGRSPSVNLLMIDAYSQPIEAEFSRATALMLPASTYAQIDIEYFRQTGERFFGGFFACPLDQASDSDGPLVGRLAPHIPELKLYVYRDSAVSAVTIDMQSGLRGSFLVAAVPAVVFIKESYTPQRKIHSSLLR